MKHTLLFSTVFVLSISLASAQSVRVIPAIITNHYSKSEVESHGVFSVNDATATIKLAVRDLASGETYGVVLLNEMTGARQKLGEFKTDKKGAATGSYVAKEFLPAYNAILIMNDEDVVQYAQLSTAQHGCICKHSGGTIVTRRMDQECYECPCGVKYEICCGGPGNVSKDYGELRREGSDPMCGTGGRVNKLGGR